MEDVVDKLNRTFPPNFRQSWLDEDMLYLKFKDGQGIDLGWYRNLRFGIVVFSKNNFYNLQYRIEVSKIRIVKQLILNIAEDILKPSYKRTYP
jgi:hypothetical protein